MNEEMKKRILQEAQAINPEVVSSTKGFKPGIDKDSFAQVYTSPADALNTHVQNLDKTTRNPNQMPTASQSTPHMLLLPKSKAA